MKTVLYVMLLSFPVMAFAGKSASLHKDGIKVAQAGEAKPDAAKKAAARKACKEQKGADGKALKGKAFNECVAAEVKK